MLTYLLASPTGAALVSTVKRDTAAASLSFKLKHVQNTEQLNPPDHDAPNRSWSTHRPYFGCILAAFISVVLKLLQIKGVIKGGCQSVSPAGAAHRHSSPALSAVKKRLRPSAGDQKRPCTSLQHERT